MRSLFARLDSLSTEISALRAQVSAITPLSSTHDSLSSQVQRIDGSLTQLTVAVESLQARSDSSDAPKRPNPGASNGVSSSGGVSLSTSPSPIPPPSTNTADSRFNIVILGIPKGTPRLARISSDASAVMDVLSEVSPDGHPPVFTRDSGRLGHYRQDSSTPRPLLVTLNSTFGVSSVLSHCRHLTSRVSIRPDLSFTAHKERGLYFRERCKLIDTGVNKSFIKIKKSGLYVSGKLAGRVVWSGPFQVEREEGSGDTAIPNVCLALRSVRANQIARATCCFPSHVIVIRLLSQWRRENNQIHGQSKKISELKATLAAHS